MRLNHPELVHKHPAHPVKRRFGTVEPPRTHVKELYTPCYLCDDVVRHPAHLASPVKMKLEKVRYGRTTPNSCERTLHTLLSLR